MNENIRWNDFIRRISLQVALDRIRSSSSFFISSSIPFIVLADHTKQKHQKQSFNCSHFR